MTGAGGTPAAGTGATPGGGLTAGAGATPGSGGSIPSGGGTISGSGAIEGGGGISPAGGTANPGGGGTSGAGGTTSQGGAAGSTMFTPSGPNTAPGYMNLAPPMGQPFDLDNGDTVTPTPPSGWNWYNVDGAVCRDGSATGLYIHKGTADKLVIFLEGGGACSSGNFCGFNPASVNTVLAGTGETVLGSAAGTGPGRQQPGVYTDATHMGAPAGMFDFTKADNPFKDWNQVYIPYCTGDVFFGTKKNATVPGSTDTYQFVGYNDMKLFIGRLVPTFKDKVSRVVLTGSSAGGFGAALNYSMVQDAFGSVLVTAVDDSGPPFDDMYMPPCMQKLWRDNWGFDDAFPPDCMECKQADGAGMVHYADFLMKKHPNGTVAIISSIQDEVIRLFYSPGLQNCMNYETANPVTIVLAQADPNTYFPAQTYTDGLNDLRTKYISTGRFATYYMGGTNITFHEHIFRDRFYTAAAGNVTIAQFVTDFLGGKMQQIGP
ncbi:MAG TPA: pectin acetylesterase-family hydrolase [Polyangiaceae bacterium]|nr:pectin acetylesterase-family hydrolase [Polyangiaceae bacterium]